MRYIIAALMLSVSAVFPQTAGAEELEWLSGCWRNEDRTYREIWSRPENGYLFGYTLSLETETEVFFEQTRIDPGPPAIFNAYPEGFGPSQFTEDSRDRNTISFVNPSQDYPQRITYARDGRRLKVTLSLMDGNEVRFFEFRRC